MREETESDNKINPLEFDLRLISRNEKTQVNALAEYYNEHDGGGTRKIRYAILFGQWGLPALVLTFMTAYWIIGMQKYYIGKS